MLILTEVLLTLKFRVLGSSVGTQNKQALLNVAEGEIWTDGGWTKVASKMNETRSGKVANNVHNERQQVTFNGYQRTMIMMAEEPMP